MLKCHTLSKRSGDGHLRTDCNHGVYAKLVHQSSHHRSGYGSQSGVALQGSKVTLYCVQTRVWTVPSLCSWKFWKIQDNFDPDGQLDSIAPLARSNPTARRGRHYLEFFKIFMNIETVLSTLSMEHSIKAVKKHFAVVGRVWPPSLPTSSPTPDISSYRKAWRCSWASKCRIRRNCTSCDERSKTIHCGLSSTSAKCWSWLRSIDELLASSTSSPSGRRRRRRVRWPMNVVRYDAHVKE